MKHINVAIDGPSGAGKSTIAKMSADKYGLMYVDTGAMYRCIALNSLLKGIDFSSQTEVIRTLDSVDIEIKYVNALQRMYLNGKDVTEDIRTPEVSTASSFVSAIPEVRNFLLDVQRNLAAKNSVIMDGRDIGTVVLPFAELKIFLTASPEDRARRRFEELTKRKIDTSYETVLNDIIERDRRDIERELAPLKPANDAVIVDTTGNSLDESFKIISELIEKNIEII